MKMLNRCLCGVVALVLPLIAPSARAALISTGLFPGDGRVTLDTDTSLEWLDVNETTNLSVANLLAGGGNDPTGPGGWITNGWRQATLSEVCGLFAPRTGGLLGCGQSIGPQSDAGIAEIQSFLGITGTEPDPPRGPKEYTGGFFDGGFAEMIRSSTHGGGAISVIPGGDPGVLAGERLGHFLVRTAPEPGVLRSVLAVIACLALHARARSQG